MRIAIRFCLWAGTGALALVVDVTTKALPHSLVAYNHSHTSPLVLVLAGALICAFGLWRSKLLAVGAGLMFGGLLGNGGELLLRGYASDWIQIGGWLTNVADISGAIGLLCCLWGYASMWKRATLIRP